jgi:hypothetical protein
VSIVVDLIIGDRTHFTPFSRALANGRRRRLFETTKRLEAAFATGTQEEEPGASDGG